MCHRLVADYIRYRQILLNILSNAIKFTDNGVVEIKIQMNYSANEQLSLITSVKDSGIGISDEQRAELFQDFSQVDASTTRKCGGTGLGLAICKHLCSLLGGKIWVESSLGQGSIFHFSIEVKKGLGLVPVNLLKSKPQVIRNSMGEEYPGPAHLIRCFHNLFKVRIIPCT